MHHDEPIEPVVVDLSRRHLRTTKQQIRQFECLFITNGNQPSKGGGAGAGGVSSVMSLPAHHTAFLAIRN